MRQFISGIIISTIVLGAAAGCSSSKEPNNEVEDLDKISQSEEPSADLEAHAMPEETVSDSNLSASVGDDNNPVETTPAPPPYDTVTELFSYLNDTISSDETLLDAVFE